MSIRLYQSTVSCLVAEVGFFIALHQIIVEMRAKHSFASFLLDLAVSASQKRRTVAFLFAYPLPPTPMAVGGVEQFKIRFATKKRKQSKRTAFSFWLRRWDLNLTTSGL